MKEQIINKLRQFKQDDLDTVFVVELEGKRLKFSSGKSSWRTIGAAKNALRNVLSMGNWRERLEEIKKLEQEEIIKYIKL